MSDWARLCVRVCVRASVHDTALYRGGVEESDVLIAVRAVAI